MSPESTRCGESPTTIDNMVQRPNNPNELDSGPSPGRGAAKGEVNLQRISHFLSPPALCKRRCVDY